MTPKQQESKANAWDIVWAKFHDHPELLKIAAEHYKSGNQSGPSILIDFIESLLSKVED